MKDNNMAKTKLSKGICPGPLSEKERHMFDGASRTGEIFSKLEYDLNTALEDPSPSIEQILDFE